MLRTDLPDHRRSAEQELLDALGARDALALAEAYHRTIGAAHACARRLLSSSSYVEALLRAVYTELWTDPPVDTPLEAWVRTRCFELGTAHLRERGTAPASPSLAQVTIDLPRPQVRYLDTAERALADLDPDDRRVLLLAHDCGVAAADQENRRAPEALRRALLALAAAGPAAVGEVAPEGAPAESGCGEADDLADWVLGLVPATRARDLDKAVADRPACADLARTLRRGRRRLEGLPPTPDMGQRILAVVLAGEPPPGAAQRAGDRARAGLPSVLDDESPWAPQQTAGAGSVTAAPASGVENDDPTEDLSDVRTIIADAPADAPSAPAAPDDTAAPEAEVDRPVPTAPAAPDDTAAPEAEADRPVPTAPVAPDDTAAPEAEADGSDEEAVALLSGPQAGVPDGLVRPSLGRRMLRWLGGLLLLLAGTALGLYLGFLIVQAL